MDPENAEPSGQRDPHKGAHGRVHAARWCSDVHDGQVTVILAREEERGSMSERWKSEIDNSFVVSPGLHIYTSEI